MAIDKVAGFEGVVDEHVRAAQRLAKERRRLLEALIADGYSQADMLAC